MNKTKTRQSRGEGGFGQRADARACLGSRACFAWPSRQVSPPEENSPQIFPSEFPSFFPRLFFLSREVFFSLETTPFIFILGFSTIGVPGRGCMSADWLKVCPRSGMWKPRTRVFFVNFWLFRSFRLFRQAITY